MRDKKIAKPVVALLGVFLLVLGITLALVCWKDVVSLFRGVGGMVLALAGMIILYLAKEN